MKTKIKLTWIAVILLLMLNFTSKAQVMPFTNSLSCDVTIGYEMWNTGCSVCSFSTILIPAGSIKNLTLCPGYMDFCVWIIDIDGCAVTANHASNSICHIMVPFGQTGTLATNCCLGITWTAILSPASWTIW